ncbi:MAG: class A beta-lactamase-related serine hydrolase [Oscillospiraceae bacterium]|nr:class A beta-lactamase-related serine hydrolase [Oscillospiraceae bacterium]
MQQFWTKLETQLKALPAVSGFYYQDLATGSTYEYNADLPLQAASVIKLFVLACTMQQIRDGKITEDTMLPLTKNDRVPGCGALSHLHSLNQVSVGDLCRLMTVISDNTATNLLIDAMGIDCINDYIAFLGCTGTRLRRRLLDAELAARGIHNTITAGEVGRLLASIARRELVSPQASDQMLAMLKDQQINHKIPFYLFSLPNAPEIAHKTGEDEGITHDCAILYGSKSYITVFCFNEADVPACERAIAELSLQIWQFLNGTN